MDPQPQKLVVLQTAFIGDVILATPVINKLHRFFPEAQIDVVVRKGNESLFEGHPFIHQVILWDKKKNKQRALANVISRVRREKYDVLVNLHRFASSGLISLLSGAKYKVGFSKNPLSFGYTMSLPHTISEPGEPVIHEVDRNLSLIRHFTDGTSEPMWLFPTKSDEAAVEKWTKEPFVTISPASVWFTKQVPESIWAELIRQLGEHKVFLLGGATDHVLCDRLAALDGTGRVRSLCGQLSLLESATLMRKAAMNYSNDSAPLHLAGSVHAPVTAVFCSTVPRFGFGPVGENGFVVEAPVSPPCRPCGLHGRKTCPEGHFKCSLVKSEDLLRPLAEVRQ